MVLFVIQLSLIAAVLAFNSDRRCLLHEGQCISHCPRGMYAYHTKCDGLTKSLRTCDDPLSYSLGYTCGWSRCDCSGEKVLDEWNSFCVDLDACPQYPVQPSQKKSTEYRRSGRIRYHMSKKIKIEEDELEDFV